MSRVRVATLIDSLEMGGAESLAVNLLHARDTSRFHDALFVLRSGGALSDRARAAVEHLECMGARRSVPVSAPRWVRGRLDAFAPALVHTHLRTSDILGAWACRRLASHPPAVVTLHTTAEGYAHGPGLRARAMWLEWRRAMGSARGVAFVAISQAVLESFLPYLPSDRPREVIENGIPLPRPGTVDRATREAARLALGVPPDAFVAVSIGGLRREKGQADLLVGFARELADQPGARLLVAGDGPERGRLETLHRELGLGGRARLLGIVADPSALWHAADVLVLPSHREGFGLVLVEALAAGIPVVATAVDAVPGLISDGVEGLLVPARQPGALGAALRRVVVEPGLQERLRHGAQAKDLSSWSIERTARAYEDLFLRLAGEAGGA
jgi:L-malate glycosyltransferase